MHYIIHYDVCAIMVLTFSILFIIFKKELKKIQNKTFFLLLILLLVTAVFDIFSAIANSYAYDYSTLNKDVLNYCYLIFHNIVPYVFTCYVILVLGIHHGKTKKFWTVFSIPIICDVVLFCLNPLTRCLFDYDNNGNYIHGKMFVLLYINAFLYIILSIQYLIRYNFSIALSKRIALLSFVAAAAVPILIQMMYPSFLIEIFIQSLSFLGILFTIENEDEILNGITGVYNRKCFINDTELTLKNKSRCETLIVKLPDLNYYTSTIGIVFANHILKQIASWLELLDNNVTVYDCDNGHFAILYYNISIRNDLIKKIQERFNNDWVCDDLSLKFNIQICVVNIPDDADNLEKLLLVTDAPLQKNNHESDVVFVDEFSTYEKELEIVHAIDKAIKNHTFQVFYQPIWSTEYNKVISAEALIRLNDDKLGFISPEIFIPIAEKNGSIIEIGRYVFDEVCRFYTANHLEKLGIEYVEVNLSVVQCMSKTLDITLLNIIKKYGLDTSRINLEITESAIANSTQTLEKNMNKLHGMGFSFSMDDYGTGYSNFSYMFDMPFKLIKLDKSILWHSEKNERAAIILRHTVNMIKDMSLEIVVEGVETLEQKLMLERLGCDFLQGYYFSRPVKGEEFIKYVSDVNK